MPTRIELHQVYILSRQLSLNFPLTRLTYKLKMKFVQLLYSTVLTEM